MYKFVLLLSFFVLTIQAQQVDPTKPFGLSSTSQLQKKVNKFVLQSIIKQDNGLIAIINNKTMKIGDKVGKYQLTEITNKQVILSSYDKSFKLTLFNDIVAKPHSK